MMDRPHRVLVRLAAGRGGQPAARGHLLDARLQLLLFSLGCLARAPQLFDGVGEGCDLRRLPPRGVVGGTGLALGVLGVLVHLVEVLVEIAHEPIEAGTFDGKGVVVLFVLLRDQNGSVNGTNIKLGVAGFKFFLELCKPLSGKVNMGGDNGRTLALEVESEVRGQPRPQPAPGSLPQLGLL
jgi:hypothetical protein